MLGNKFTSRIEGNSLSVKNITNEMIPDCLVHVRNIFSNSVIFETTDFGPKETKTFYFINDAFMNNWLDQKFYLSIYSKNILIYNKNINDKTKCYLIYSNKNFENLAEQLIVGLNRYSSVDILHYTINYSSSLDYPNLKNIEFSIDGDVADGQYMQFMKPKVFLDSLSRGYKSVVFLDADIQVRPNIDELFDYVKEIESAPIFQKAKWDFTTVHGKYIPGPLLNEFMQLPKQQYPQGVTNVVIFDSTHQDLFKEWERVCFSDEINEIRKKEFLHDELILNCLCWKYGLKPKQFNLFLNVTNLDDVDFFYSTKVEYIESLDMNSFGHGHHRQSYIPYERNSIKGFHCIKESSTALEINNYIRKNESMKKV